ncbi:transcription termination factor Rho [Gordonia sp. FQ]|uniref:transcription termination factor Rho n=1 Tax=Gordonia sp. FQ TaxID=3446634 RepID=UPI003F86D701
MLLPELRTVAAGLGIKGISGMRKGALIDAIRAQQSGGAANTAPAGKPAADKPVVAKTAEKAPAEKAPAEKTVAEKAPADSAPKSGPEQGEERGRGARRGENRDNRNGENRNGANKPDTGDKGAAKQGDKNNADKNNDARGEKSDGNKNDGNRNDGGNKGGQRNQGNQGQGGQNQGNQNQGNQGPSDDGEGGGRRRGRRLRERNRRNRDRGDGGGGAEPQLNEGDVVAPVAGILDVLDNYAFVRTSGYLPGPNDVYVSMNMVRRYGLRRGDAITGAVKVPRDGEQGGGGGNQRQKFNPLVRLDTVNGGDPELSRKRPDFTKLTPLYPNQRLRLETTPERLSTRVIDLIMPIGKGQRALIVSPPKAGKTTILQDIANAITTNNPECHLMVVLVDERPEEVTDMQRSVKGEVIASTFDRPPSDHTTVAELAIERAKRLVEQGKDVVVLLDSITRLGRAYNNASPASGRILSGGVDSTALYPPKRFLGAARNIENGGSLTIIASALVETGSTGDTVIFEEFKGTGNAELKLDRKISERRVFPAVDVNLSSTRKDELLLSPDEFAIVHKLRRLLAGLDSQQAIDLLVSQLKKTRNNVEFLMQVSKTAPGGIDND